MPTYPKAIEVERINNIAKNFGWELVKQEQMDKYFSITFRKEMAVEVDSISEDEAG